MTDHTTDHYATVPLNKASLHCTFALLLPRPHSIPANCTLSSHATLRLEAPPNLSNVPHWKENTVATNDLNAIEYHSGGVPYWTPMRNSCAVYHVHSRTTGRSIRIKQYLFLDYGPHPTHHSMIPPIGSYAAKTQNIPGPRLEFHIGQRACGWLGVDYAGLPVAQAMLQGTCIEIRITKGLFEDQELIALCNGLVAEETEEAIKERTYHMHASYYQRYPATHHAFLVPSSLFARDVSNFGLPHCAYPRWMAAAKAPTTVPRLFGSLVLNSFGVLDGNGTLSEKKKEKKDLEERRNIMAPMETFALYTDRHCDSMAWVRTIRGVGPKEEAPLWPPQPGAYPCDIALQEYTDLEHYHMFTAHVTKANGPHCAAIKSLVNGQFHFIHATPRPGFDVPTFIHMVTSLMGVHSKI